ncbi:multiple sugar-binding periplasmic receptor [Renibacterium salmoninarum ATCC 33209]|uniref:Multiple sugar-binding periplasmic receptor n=1 Tax=Renibacterium salmoninarum (strain ATCC 33209 / DSM 20767 / JCM 11484 / NBRC 15589 / NCIMB 2235) TaxID=288705 RepID=A9WM28_RENSM|nr:multiple sugar-binding periplasmic receptor [Renibacterium salmoninarum ATCC 33209]
MENDESKPGLDATTSEQDNGTKKVPTKFLDPVIVTKANAAEAYANDPTLGPLTK